jgi:hypothetical protein
VNLDISQSRLTQSIIPSHPLSPIFPMAFGKKEIIGICLKRIAKFEKVDQLSQTVSLLTSSDRTDQ